MDIESYRLTCLNGPLTPGPGPGPDSVAMSKVLKCLQQPNYRDDMPPGCFESLSRLFESFGYYGPHETKAFHACKGAQEGLSLRDRLR